MNLTLDFLQILIWLSFINIMILSRSPRCNCQPLDSRAETSPGQNEPGVSMIIVKLSCREFLEPRQYSVTASDRRGEARPPVRGEGGERGCLPSGGTCQRAVVAFDEWERESLSQRQMKQSTTRGREREKTPPSS
ncbi:hypothetical protein B0T22DRAFT_466592 [Podospora appendiculata]|uniref:Uncharacterized protein n=1 Tax=Podospora appendiculata TaxID=314037 RepID=A0AAE1CAQ6_9PEZI|nr:hypothetical protein B0T22DRAFT_466592 [Podospora appendiculata]